MRQLFDDLLTISAAPEKRTNFCVGGIEHHLPEGAVMVAYALHLLQTTEARRVRVHPDGEHGKRFPFRAWLERRGYEMRSPLGATAYGGIYAGADGREIEVNPKSGFGDLSAELPEGRIVAETKGGIINTKHPGQVSRLRKGLCEAVGLLLASDVELGTRQVAVVPYTLSTARLGQRMIKRTKLAGIGISLVDGSGNVIDLY
jgi:hypothetical protein